MSIWAKARAIAIRSLLPQDCLLCGAAAGAEMLCAACAAGLPGAPEPACPRCAAPSPGGECGACLRHPPAFDAALAAFRYTYPLDRMVQALKYGHRLALADWFAQRMARTVARPQADVLAPLPLHPRRLAERGFNQAAEIARRLARTWQMAYEPALGRRIADTTPQVQLPWAARRKNVRGAFLCERALDGRHIVLVDDVMTTGATLDAMARACKARGARSVTCVLAARALPEVSPGPAAQP